MYDVIRSFGKKNPYQILENIGKAYPETLQNLEGYNFPHSRGPKTPVADFVTMVQIAMHIRGELAAKFRERVARLIFFKMYTNTLRGEVLHKAVSEAW